MPKYETGDTALWAYIAGFFDGEGSISIARTGKYYSLRIVISNTNIEPLTFIKNILGGNIHAALPKNVKHKRYYNWYKCGKHAAEVLEILLPFLIVKRERAILAIEYNLSLDKWHKAQLINELSALNKKGRKGR